MGISAWFMLKVRLRDQMSYHYIKDALVSRQ